MAKPIVRKVKKKANPLKAAKVEYIDYKDTGRQRDQERPRDGAAAVLELGSLSRGEETP